MPQVLRERAIGILTAEMSTRAVARECYVHYATVSVWYPIGSYELVSSLQLPNGLGRGESRESCVLRKHAKPRCVLTHCSLNPKASCTNVSEETLSNWQPKSGCRHPTFHKESLENDEPRKSHRPNPPLTRMTLGQAYATQGAPSNGWLWQSLVSNLRL